MALTVVGLSSQSSTQLTRTLERVFEDAQLTGELRLSGRRLREYPTIASEYQLCDIVTADLSKNRFTELPNEVCEFFLLERLDCYHNVMRHIPESVITLQSLTYLNLSRNQLTTIPPALCQLPLQVLILSNNRLVSIPEEIGHMHCLSDLDVSCNEISLLPPHIGDLDSLKSLNVRRNQLVELPSEICDLKLSKLDISANRISTLPPNLRFMVCLQELVLDCNPLVSPPAFLCKRGRTHVFKYLEIQAIKEDKKRGILLESELRRSYRKLGVLSDFRYQNGLTSDSCGKRCTVDSGYNTSDGGDKRWSQEYQELNGDLEDSRRLALRAAALTKGQRLEREWLYNNTDSFTSSSLSISTIKSDSPNGLSSISTPSTLSPTNEINLEDVFNEQEVKKDEITSGNDCDEKAREECRRLARKVLEQQLEEARKLQERSPAKVVGKKDLTLLHQDIQPSSPLTYRQFKENSKYQKGSDSVYRRISFDKTNNLGNSKSSSSTISPVPLSEKFSKSDRIPCNQYHDEMLEENDERWKQSQKNAFLSYMKESSLNYHSPGKKLTNGTHKTAYSPPQQKQIDVSKFNFTAKRDIDKAKEEQNQISQLRCIIETRLKVTLPDDLSSALMDGVVLCHLANRVKPHSVASIHVPSSAVPKLSIAKCRRNVENFLEACKKIGVPKEHLCRWEDVVMKLHVGHVACTVRGLLYASRNSYEVVSPGVSDVVLSLFLLNLLLGTFLLLYFYPPPP